MKNKSHFTECTEILPIWQDDSITVVFETSGMFVPYMSVAILSLLKHIAVEHNYDILILSHQMTEEEVQTIEGMCNGYENVSIRVFNPFSMVEKYISTARYSYLDINYYRMCLPWILPHYNKIINLGADLIINRDIAALFTELMAEHCYLGGIVDIGYQGRLRLDISKKELRKKDPGSYVNADVLVFQLDKIRRDFDKDGFMNFWQKQHFRCAEQDALNVIFDEHIYLYDPKWNVFPEGMSSEFDILHASQENIQNWNKSLKDPYLIHFAALPKPWDDPSVGEGQRWWKLAQESPYYQEIQNRMNSGDTAAQPMPKRLSDLLFPQGTKRHDWVKRLFQKGSLKWIYLKKLQYFIKK